MSRRGFQGAVLRGLGVRYHTAAVLGTEDPLPHMRRVWLSAPTLFEDITIEPTAWLRFWFPDPAGSETEFQRGYTIAEVDVHTGRFAVDFVLHEPSGPASTWARQVSGGETVEVASFGSKGFAVDHELPAGYLLIGDAASIPAINTVLDAVPHTVDVEVYLEQHHEDDRHIALSEHPRARVHWVPRTSETAVADALDARDWSDWKAWAGSESKSLKHIRARLKGEFGFPKAEIHAQAYWVHGRSMGTQRDGSEIVADEPPDARTVAETSGADTASVATTTPPFATTTPPEDRSGSRSDAASPAVSRRRGHWRSQAGGRLLRPLRPALWTAGILQFLVTLLQLSPYLLLVELARNLLAGSETSTLWTLGLWALGLLGAGALLETALQLWLHTVDARFGRDLRGRLLGKLSRLPLGWFTARTSGRIDKLVSGDTLSLHYLVTHAVTDAVAAAVAPVAVLGYLFWVDWRLALVLLLPVLAYVFTMATMMAQSGPKIVQSQQWAERMKSEATSYLDGQPVIRAFGGSAASQFRRSLDDYVGFLGDWQRPFVGKKSAMDLATRPVTFLWLIAVVGTVLVTTDRLDPVDLLPFLFLGTTFGARLLGIGYGVSGLREGQLAARNIQNVLDERELGTSTSVGAAEEPAGRVVFDDVTFGYRTGVPVVENVSLTLEPGTITALVGPSGAGKSTVAALLARFHDLDGGSIRVGGRDIATLDPDELYTKVGFVFQDAQLVHGTVRENIALAVPDASDEDVERAARGAQIHDRILRLPDGYGTVLGTGSGLSGGERQRITIARALLADTPVLILDEATAFADPESEFLVQRAIDRLAAGRTVLVIAHRLRTVTGADRIVVLDGGRVAQCGTHDALLASGGRYRRLWEAGNASETQEYVR
ncbi:ABC transporter ATP-binding protein/permease [Rhodococcus sp. HNM0569]|uniref:ABC transporter ATP-binding protein/permease n=1 Tax=Rhodococcus sp. HNM0569 TaxID=2716340 RepID=UPI001469AACC|nr:ABC transporter ATP-binding protein/permease [Rhodococcus sp. HNM0569]NLU82548.1 ATP-binding cassette domain-containing protein [Rhodococcus sp. HNM0569]